MQAGAISGGISAGIGGLVEGSYLSGMQNIAHGMSAGQIGGILGGNEGINNMLNQYPDLRSQIGRSSGTKLSTLARYRHYGYWKDTLSLLKGMRPGSYGTTDIYTSGSVAQQMLALPPHGRGILRPMLFSILLLIRLK